MPLGSSRSADAPAEGTWRTPRRLPLGFGHTGARVHGARHDKQQVRKAVDVGHHERLDRVGTKRHDATLCPSADRSREMKHRAGWSAAGEDEAPERTQAGLERVN